MASLKYAVALSLSLLAVAASAQSTRPPKEVRMPTAGSQLKAKAVTAALLTYGGGPTITSAKVVFIFWGPSFNNSASADFNYARNLQTFRNQFGTTGEYNVITQYSGIALANLASGTADWFDTSTPPARVTDALVQSKVASYLTTHAFNNSTIYEVVIPSSSFSDDGTGATSCGGTNLQYCAYHWFFLNGSNHVKYSIQPYASCSGCKVSGWTALQNQEHFVTHETREAVTDPEGTGWTDSTGFEADDECAWSPTPFLAGGFGYQYEWSNLTNSCVKTR